MMKEAKEACFTDSHVVLPVKGPVTNESGNEVSLSAQTFSEASTTKRIEGMQMLLHCVVLELVLLLE